MIIYLWNIYCHECGKVTPHTALGYCVECTRREHPDNQVVKLIDIAMRKDNISEQGRSTQTPT